MRTMPAVSRTGSGMNACAIYVSDLARRVESLAGSGCMPAPVVVPPPATIPAPQKPPVHAPVFRRRPAYMPAPVRPVSSEFFEEP